MAVSPVWYGFKWMSNQFKERRPHPSTNRTCQSESDTQNRRQELITCNDSYYIFQVETPWLLLLIPLLDTLFFRTAAHLVGS